MRLETERPPDAADRRLGHPRRRRQRPCRPVRRIRRRLLERLDDHPLHVVVTDRPRCTRTRFIMEAVEPAVDEAPTPLAHRAPTNPRSLGDLDVVPALRARQHDPAPQRQRLRCARTPRPTLKRCPLLATQDQRRLGTTCCSHAGLPSSLTMTPNAAPTTEIPSNQNLFAN